MALIGHWTLAEDNYSGGVFQDLTANNNDVTPANAPVFTTNQQEREDRATVFVKASFDELIKNNPANLSSASGSITFWAKFTVLGVVERIFELEETFANDYLVIFKGADNKIYIRVVDAGVLKVSRAPTSTISTGWHHIAITHTGSTTEIFIDNVDAIATGTDGAFWTAHLVISKLNIGHNYNGYMDGDIDNVRIYDTALTPAERAVIYNAELFWNPITIDAEMDFSGALAGSNPDWLVLDDILAWQGEWDEEIYYSIGDTVLYQAGDEFHVFISKISHNVSNIPTSSA